VGYKQFASFLPTGSAFKPMMEIIKLLAGPEFDFDVQLVLKAEEVPGTVLTTRARRRPMLRWNTWLRSRPFERDDEQVLLAPAPFCPDFLLIGSGMNVNLKSLIARLNDTCRAALEGAAGLCLSRTNYDVEIEHYLIKLLEAQDADLPRILDHFEVGMSRLNKDLTRALDRLKTGNSRTPALSPRLPLLVQEAWLLASIEFREAKIRSGHLLLALLGNDELGRLAVDIS